MTSASQELVALRFALFFYEIRLRHFYLFQQFAMAFFESLEKAALNSHNHLGSGALVTDSAGNEVFRTTYSEYGEIDLANSGKYNPATGEIEHHLDDALIAITAVKYTGQEYDPETGFYYYNARYYDPQLGVFTTADTVFDERAGSFGFNRHMYVAGNPVMYSDPSGHNIFDDIGDFFKRNADAIKTVVSVIANPVAAINAGTAAWAGANIAAASNGGSLTAQQGWAAFGIGAQAGAIAAVAAIAGGVGGMGAGAVFGAGFFGTVGTGAVGGFVGGFAQGSLSGWNSGRNFEDGILDGLSAGGWGALTGAAFAGLGYALSGSGQPANSADDFVDMKKAKFTPDLPDGMPCDACTKGDYYLSADGRKVPHRGWDLKGAEGTPIKATRHGQVVFAGEHKGYGNTVVLRHSSGRMSVYAHLEEGSISVKLGQHMRTGDMLGRMGGTGDWSRGIHLHYQIMEAYRGTIPNMRDHIQSYYTVNPFKPW